MAPKTAPAPSHRADGDRSRDREEQAAKPLGLKANPTIPPNQAGADRKSLAVLAERLNAEHEAFVATARRSLQHAMACGDILIEAKAQLEHGKWLPWLQANCSVSERSARVYMRLAKNRTEIETKSALTADLTIAGAVELLAPATVPAEPTDTREPVADLSLSLFDDRQPWCRMLFEPFTDRDFEDSDWLITKLLHVAKVPAIPCWALNIDRDYKKREILGVIPWDALTEAIKRIAPYGTGEARIAIEATRSLRKSSNLQIHAMRLLGGLLKELDLRKKLDEDALRRRSTSALDDIMAQLDKEVADLDETEAAEGIRAGRMPA